MKRKPDPILTICVVAFLLSLIGLVWVPFARSAPPPGADPNSEIGLWFRSLENSKGENCCSVADCRRPFAWRHTGTGYEVQAVAGSPWIAVPPENILRRENLIGDAVACIVGGQVRCFIAPQEA